jgi:hypothetical protein
MISSSVPEMSTDSTVKNDRHRNQAIPDENDDLKHGWKSAPSCPPECPQGEGCDDGGSNSLSECLMSRPIPTRDPPVCHADESIAAVGRQQVSHFDSKAAHWQGPPAPFPLPPMDVPATQKVHHVTKPQVRCEGTVGSRSAWEEDKRLVRRAVPT